MKVDHVSVTAWARNKYELGQLELAYFPKSVPSLKRSKVDFVICCDLVLCSQDAFE